MTGTTRTGGFHRPERLAVVAVELAPDTHHPRVYLSAMPSGPVLVLDRPAADIWRAAVAVHDPQAVVAAMADAFGMSADEIHDDVMGFLAELRNGGLLAWRDAPDTN